MKIIEDFVTKKNWIHNNPDRMELDGKWEVLSWIRYPSVEMRHVETGIVKYFGINTDFIEALTVDGQ